MAFSARISLPKVASLSNPVRANITTLKSKQLNEKKRTFCAPSTTQNSTFKSSKRLSVVLNLSACKGPPSFLNARRAYSSEMANALVEVSQNMGMGSAAIGLGGASIGIGLVFASFLSAVARNPAFRSQLFTYAIIGFGFVEAMGLFDLMIAMMCKYV